MARTVKGKRMGFDNIAVGSASGIELTIAGTSVAHGAQTTVNGNGELVRTSEGTSAGSALGNEIFWKTVAGGQVSDRTTDKGF